MGRWYRWRVHRFAHVELDAKCPACGHFRGVLRCSVEARMIEHRCLVCGALWGEPFVVAADVWLAPWRPPQLPVEDDGE